MFKLRKCTLLSTKWAHFNWMLQVSKKLARGQQKAEKARHLKRFSWENILQLIKYIFLLSTFFYFIFFTHNTTQHPKYNKTKQQTHTQHLKVQSKGKERGKDNKNTKVTPLYNHVYQTKNTAKHQWLKAWPHQLAPLYIHTTLFAGGYGSKMFFHTCEV